MIYLDTSAFVKLIWHEAETTALRRFISEHDAPELISSTILAIESRRAVLREDPTQLPRTDLLLTRVGQIALAPGIVESASRLPEPFLRSLNAIHLATALLVSGELDAVVTYDKRLASAANTHGLTVAAPGS